MFLVFSYKNDIKKAFQMVNHVAFFFKHTLSYTKREMKIRKLFHLMIFISHHMYLKMNRAVSRYIQEDDFYFLQLSILDISE